MFVVSLDEIDTLLDALERLQGTGPEFDGFLANHGPMAAEALTRIGGAAVVPRWVDHYLPRLAAAPEVIRGIGDDDWPEHLGQERLFGDWTRTSAGRRPRPTDARRCDAGGCGCCPGWRPVRLTA